MTVEKVQDVYNERLQYQMNLQAGQIQNVLAGHGMSTTVSSGSASKNFINFNLHSRVSGSLQHLRGIKDELKRALGVDGIRLLNEDGGLQLQLIRPFEPAVPLLDLLAFLHDVPPATAVLGLTEDGAPVLHDFTTEAQPNILISGQAEAGKTVLLRTIAASLALYSSQAHLQLVAVNPVSGASRGHETQDSSLKPLNYLPHMLTDAAVRQTEITELMLFLVREMHFRMEQDFTMPRIVVLIDQAATVMEHGGRMIIESINKLAQRGANAGIHLVLSTRRPDADVFGPNLATNLQARFVGRFDMPELSAEKSAPIELEASTLLGEGDFLAQERSQTVRFQAAYINDYDLHMCLSRLYQVRPILLAQPLSKRVKLEPNSTASKVPSLQFSFDEAMAPVG